MAKANRALIAVVLGVCLAGCGEKRIDATSMDTMKTSMEAVRNSLPEAERPAFDEAYKALVVSGALASALSGDNKDQVLATAKDAVHGKTAEEIIAAGKTLKEKHKAEAEKLKAELDQQMQAEKKEKTDELKADIAKIEQQVAAAEQAKEQLKKFTLSNVQLALEKTSFLESWIVTLTATNNIGKAISRAYVDAVVTSPSRSVPWTKASIIYQIPGGVEPGEQVTWKLSQGMSTEWYQVPKDRNDLQLTLTVVRLDDAAGQPIFDAQVSKWDLEKLERLKQELQTVEKQASN